MINCPICNAPTSFLTDKKDRFGQAYEYLLCTSCRFLFEKGLVEGKESLAKKVANVYQKDYFDQIDTGWKLRADAFLSFLKPFLNVYGLLRAKKPVKVLDYGGGNGYIAAELSKQAKVFYYDKYDKPTIFGDYTILEKPQKADVVCAVELVEHLIDIQEWDFLRQLSPGLFIFTTGLSDNVVSKDLVAWEYFNPDAGHTALYSSQALHLLAKKYGFAYVFFPNIASHIFFKSAFLSNINFVWAEYVIYTFFRRIKNIVK